MTDDKKGNEDIVLEADEETTAEGGVTEKMKSLREKLKKCEAEKQEYLAGWQRTKADFINARREEEGHRNEFVKHCEQNFAKELLHLTDSLDALLENVELLQKVDEGFKTGMQNVHAQLMHVLNKHGIKTIDSMGKKFDPREHEAIGEEKVDSQEKDGMILKEIRKGYKLHEKIIRPAQVKVGKA